VLVELEADESEVVPLPAFAELCGEGATPGIVAAAMPPSTATAATPPTATHVVIVLIRRIASSRASIRARVLPFMVRKSAYSLSAQAWSNL
jgi:hypothetical protein